MKEKIRISYIGGGSRLWARKMMSDLALDNDLGGIVSLYDINPEAANTNSIVGNLMMKLPEASGNFTFEPANTLEDSLQNADFVFISILPGTYDEMEKYVHLPEKYGIFQPVGDTAGIGGIFRSLIMMPMFEEIAKAIEKICPNAWVVNFTNPMSMCLKTLYHVFPKIKAFGNCHEVFSTQKLLAKALKAETGIDADFQEMAINPMGINHFTWIDKASYKNIDLFPIYEKYSRQYIDTGILDDDYKERGFPFASSEKVKINLFHEYGVIAAAGDRHLVEFFQNNRFLDKDPLDKWGFYLTPVSYRKTRMSLDDKDAKDISIGTKEPEISTSGEEGVRQIRALLGLEEFITNVNLPNQGQIKNLPDGAIVETNAYFKKDSIQPVFAGVMPESIKDLTLPHIQTHNLLIKAFVTRNLEYAKEALFNDITVKHLERNILNEIFKEITKEIKTYLAYYED